MKKKMKKGKQRLPRRALAFFLTVLCALMAGCGRQEEISSNSAKEKNPLCMETQYMFGKRAAEQAETVSLTADWITVPPGQWEFTFSGNAGLMIVFQFPNDGAEYSCDCWATGEGMLFIDDGECDIQKESNHQIINQSREVLIWNNMYRDKITPENYADGPGLLEVVLRRNDQIMAYAVVRYYIGEAEGHNGPLWIQELLEEHRFTEEEVSLSEEEKEQKINSIFAEWETQYGFERIPEWKPYEDGAATP